ncbi:MAG: GNAT family N-acetyltransferase [Mobilitalea sp.]
MIEAKLLTGKDNLNVIFNIRHRVFIDELQMQSINVFDNYDNQAIHVIVYLKEQDVNYPVASGRIIYDGSNCEIDKICVLKEYRRNKYGDFAVRMLLNKAFNSGINTVIVKTPKNIEKFFKSIGFCEAKLESGDLNSNLICLKIESNSIVKQCKNLSKNS